jgi:ketosteroid isomerase-like protein
MAEHPNVLAVRRGYDAFNKGDSDTLVQLFDETVVWHVPGRSSIAGDYEGLEAIMAYFGRLDELTDGTYHAELQVAVGDEEHVVSIDRSSATTNGSRYDENELVVFRFRGGRVVEAWQAMMNPYAHDEFFA